MDNMEFQEKVKGIQPVQLCPYTDDIELDVEGLIENTQFLVDFANDGDKDMSILTNGSTAEFYANTLDEQKELIQTVVETADGDVPVIAGVSQAGTRKTIELARYAEDVGVDGVMVVLPYYHSPSKSGLIKHYRAIAESIDTPITVYNNADVSGTILSTEMVKELSQIDNIAALKDNSTIAGDYASRSATIDSDDMALLCGKGEAYYMAASSFGQRYIGFITVIGNFAPSLAYEHYQAIQGYDYDRAFEIYSKIKPFFDLIGKAKADRGSFSVLAEPYEYSLMYQSISKAALEIVGLNGGPVRGPMENITSGEREELRGILQELEVV